MVAAVVASWPAFFATAVFAYHYPSCQEGYGERRSNNPAICDGFDF